MVSRLRSRNKIPDIEDTESLLKGHTSNTKLIKNLINEVDNSSADIGGGDGQPIFKENEKVDNVQWSPANWQKTLQNIRLMRIGSNAPVDTMGCHKCADEDADEKTQRFQKLVALMLSSQTKDEVIYSAMTRLKEHGLTAASVHRMTVPELERILHPISFYKNKAKYLHKTAGILLDQYNGDIPDNVKDLIALPGVGPKMAHICMATAWNNVSGIGVDVHVHRISNRLGWVPKSTKEPEQTRLALESWLPKELWPDINTLFVGFGQTICSSVHPKCERCLNRSICPYLNRAEKSGGKLALEAFENVQKSKIQKVTKDPPQEGQMSIKDKDKNREN